MSQDLVKQQSNIAAFAMNESELINVLTNSLFPGASEPSVKMVINYCKASQLDPMQKPVHIVPMWNSKAGQMRDVIMPGIGMYRTQAARGGDYAGVDDPEFGPDVTETIGGVEVTYPAWCKVTVKRRLSDGMIVSFSAIERWKENYAVKGGKDRSIAPNTMWEKRPYAQLNKCAEAQALRKAFPEVGSQPTAEEMEGKSSDINYEKDITGSATVETVREPETLPDYPVEKFDKNYAMWASMIESGTKTNDQIVSMLQSKFTLTTDMINKLNRITKKVAA